MLVLIIKYCLALLLGALPGTLFLQRIHTLLGYVFNGLKGWLAAAILPALSLPWLGVESSPWLAYLCGVFVIIGQRYSPFSGTLNNAVATTVGVLIAVEPWAFTVLLPVWLLTLWFSGYVSLATMLAAVSLPIFMLLTGTPANSPPMGFALLLLGLIIHWYKPHLERLHAGQEIQETRFKWRQ